MDPLFIFLLTLTSCIFWHLVYRWILLQGASKYESLLLTSVSQSVLVVCCFITDSTEYLVLKDNSRIEELYMVSATGFFLHDTPHWRPGATLTSASLLVHHLLAFFLLLAVLFQGFGGSVALLISFIMEVNTPLLALRHFLRKQSRKGLKLVELMYAMLFVVLRLWLFLDIILSLVQKPTSEVPHFLKAGAVGIYLVSFGLLPGVIKMVLLHNVPTGRRTAPKRKR